MNKRQQLIQALDALWRLSVVLVVPVVTAVPWADLKASYPFRGRFTLTPMIRRGRVSMSKRVRQTGKTLGPFRQDVYGLFRTPLSL